MGAMKNAKAEKQSRKFKRKDSDRGGVADWTNATPNILVAAVATVAAVGGALRLGYTRDGGAYAIGVYGDGDPYTEYVRPSEDLDEFLQSLVETFS